MASFVIESASTDPEVTFGAQFLTNIQCGQHGAYHKQNHSHTNKRLEDFCVGFSVDDATFREFNFGLELARCFAVFHGHHFTLNATFRITFSAVILGEYPYSNHISQ